VFFAVFC
jgi:hypothetical protein